MASGSFLQVKTADRYEVTQLPGGLTRLVLSGPCLADHQPIFVDGGAGADTGTLRRQPLLHVDAVHDSVFRVHVVGFPHFHDAPGGCDNAGERELKTFMTCGPAGKMPEAGRSRDDTRGVYLPPERLHVVAFSSREGERPFQVALVSRMVTVTANLTVGNFALAWYHTAEIEGELADAFGIRLGGAAAGTSCASAVLPGGERMGGVFRSAAPILAELPGNSYAWQRATGEKFHYLPCHTSVSSTAASEGAACADQDDGGAEGADGATEDCLYYGLGEKAGGIVRNGGRFRLATKDALGYDAGRSDPLYKHTPFYITFDRRRGQSYGLLYDNASEGEVDFGREHCPAFQDFYRYYKADAGPLDYFFLAGPTMSRVTQQLAYLTGRQALGPAYLSGYLGSSMNLVEGEEGQKNLEQFWKDCQEYGVRISMFHLSSGFTVHEGSGHRSVFHWNLGRFPDPRAMFNDTFARHNMAVAPNVKPHLLQTNPLYPEAEAGGLFVFREAGGSGRAPAVGGFWRLGAHTVYPGALLDFSNPRGAAFWRRHVREDLLDHGAAVVWNDNNEYTLDDMDAQTLGFEGDAASSGPLRLCHAGKTTQTLLMARASYEAMAEHMSTREEDGAAGGNKFSFDFVRFSGPEQCTRVSRRPAVITRSAGVGTQRYCCQTWSGDNYTGWGALRYNIPMAVSMSVSGFPAGVGWDTGGFAGPSPSEELLTRWVQHAVFAPRFVIHSWKPGRAATSMWMFGGHGSPGLRAMRAANNFRYTHLLAYLYQGTLGASTLGLPMLRPLVFEFPSDPRVHRESFNFMLRDGVLVAPVLRPGQAEVQVYLPQTDSANPLKSCDWYDWHTGEALSGGETVSVHVGKWDDAASTRPTVPAFVRSGRVLCLSYSGSSEAGQFPGWPGHRLGADRGANVVKCQLFPCTDTIEWHEEPGAPPSDPQGRTVELLGLSLVVEVEEVQAGSIPTFEEAWADERWMGFRAARQRDRGSAPRVKLLDVQVRISAGGAVEFSAASVDDEVYEDEDPIEVQFLSPAGREVARVLLLQAAGGERRTHAAVTRAFSVRHTSRC